MGLELSIEEVARIEGHAGINVVIEGNNVITEFKVFEGARLFEDFLIGRRADEVPKLASRICGICGITHSVAASKAIDKALGIKVNDNVKLVRELLLNLNIIESHLLHVVFLSLPDIFGVNSFLELPKEVLNYSLRIINFREAIGNLIKLLVGDRVHGKTFTVGGFTYLPPREEVMEFKDILSDAYEAVKEFTEELISKYEEWFKSIILKKRKHFVALSSRNYSPYDGVVSIDDRVELSEDEFTNEIREVSVTYSTAKRVYLKNGEPFMVGALARLITNRSVVPRELSSLLNQLLREAPEVEPGLIPLAQLIESAYLILKSLTLIDRYERKPSLSTAKLRGGTATALVEAPRGILLHHYSVDPTGVVRNVNIITPTAFFAADLEDSLKHYTLNKLGMGIPLSDLRRRLEDIVRCYDPCISCSVHVIRIKD